MTPPPPRRTDTVDPIDPGPVRVRAAVDLIVGHLRRLILQQAWVKWQPKLTQGEVAARILERQRLRLEEGLSSSLDPPASSARWRRRVLTPSAEGGKHSLCNGKNEYSITEKKSVSYPAFGGSGTDIGRGGAGGKDPVGASVRSGHGVRGRARSRSSRTGGTSTGATAASSSVPRVGGSRNGGGGGGGIGGAGTVRCLSSPAAVAGGSRKAGSGRNISWRSSAGLHDTWTQENVVSAQCGKGEQHSVVEAGLGPSMAAPYQKPGSAIATKTSRSSSMLTMQTCFKQEREAFIRDLQTLHRQLDAKDKDYARRQRESQAACAQARAETRAAIERATSLQKEADDAAAAQAEAEARAEVAAEELDRQTTEVDTLRTRLRRTMRLHKEQMDLERRQKASAVEGSSAERRRLESSALTARKDLSDGRRSWAMEKDTLLAAVKEACQRADLLGREGEEAKSHAALLEERLQQTLERETSLHEEIEALTISGRDGERRVARAEADAARVKSAAAAQEKAFLETLKSLEERAARAEVMQGGERATREDLHAMLEEAREETLATSSKAQRELDAANLREVSLGEETAALRAEVDALRRRAVAADALVGSAEASTGDMGARLEKALSENRRLVAAAAAKRELLDQQWRRREERWRLDLVRARRGESVAADLTPSGPSGQLSQDGRVEEGLKEGAEKEGAEKEGAVMPEARVLAEVDELRQAMMRLVSDKERLLDQLSRSTTTVTASTMTSMESPRGRAIDRRCTCPCESADSWVEGDEASTNGSARDEDRGITERSRGVEDEEDFEEEEEEEREEEEDGGDTSGWHGHGRSIKEEGRRKSRRVSTVRSDDSRASSDEPERGGQDDQPEQGAEEEGKGRREEGDREDKEDEEALLMPRGGPVPVPSRLPPRSSNVGLGARGSGGWSGYTPLGTSVAAAALLRKSLERERAIRRWQHDSLVNVLREGNVILDCHSPSACLSGSPSPARADAALTADAPPVEGSSRDGDASAVPQHDHEHKHNAENSGLEENSLERARSDQEGEEEGDGYGAEEEAWRDILDVLRRFLQASRGCGRGLGRSVSRMGGGGEHDDRVDHHCPPERRQRAQGWEGEQGLPPCTRRSVGQLDGIESCSGVCCARGGDRRETERGAPSASSSCRSGISSPPPPASSSSFADENNCNSRRSGGARRCCARSSMSPGRRTAGSGDGGGGCDGGGSVCATDDVDGGEGSGGKREAAREMSLSTKMSDADADADDVRAFSGTLVAALRELLSSTLGVSEEGVKEAPLPELVRALQREWENLLEGLSVMQNEVDLARHQAASMASSTTSSPQRDSMAEEALRKSERRVDELEASLAEVSKAEDSLRERAEAAAVQAEKALQASEHDRSEVTARLAAALRDLAKERADGAVRLAALKADLGRAVSAAEAAAAAEAAETAEKFRLSLEAAVQDGEDKAGELRTAVREARRRAGEAEERFRELEASIAADRGSSKKGGEGEQREVEEEDEGDRSEGERRRHREREEGREAGRREAEERVKALEAALEKLAETGSAAERLSKEQLEIARELSAERDELVQENERSAARLDQLTAALQEQREGKARLANQLLDRERGLEALQAQGDVEKVNVARLQAEVEKAQGVCREMADRLLELQATQDELQSTRSNFEQASQELETLRRSKDRLSGGWDEANRLRERLGEAEGLCAEMSARVATVEPLVEEESRRARHLEAKVDALQRQLDEVPKDLLVAHAEKRVLERALDEAEKHVADTKASTAAELRRRDADARSFASAAALQHERCGERLREQALTIHQLTLEGFGAEASAQALQQQHHHHKHHGQHHGKRREEHRGYWQHLRRSDHPPVSAEPPVGSSASTAIPIGTLEKVAAAAAAAAAPERKARPAPRRGYYRYDGDENDVHDRGIWMKNATSRRPRPNGLDPRRSDPSSSRAGLRADGINDAAIVMGVANGGGRQRDEGDGAVGGTKMWAGYSLDSEFPSQRAMATATLTVTEGGLEDPRHPFGGDRGGGRRRFCAPVGSADLRRGNGKSRSTSTGSNYSCSSGGSVWRSRERGEEEGRATTEAAHCISSRPAPAFVDEKAQPRAADPVREAGGSGNGGDKRARHHSVVEMETVAEGGGGNRRCFTDRDT